MAAPVTTRPDAPAFPLRRARGTTRGDLAFRGLTTGAAWLVLIVLVAAAASMAWGGRLAFQTFGWGFITGSDWDAVGQRFGALVPIYGTLVSSAIAMLIAVDRKSVV